MPRNELTEAEVRTKRDAQTKRVFRQQAVALAVLGLAVLGFSVWRAGWQTIFHSGWWRW